MIVVWHVTDRCNLSCPFCGFDASRKLPRRNASRRQIRSLAPVLREYQDMTRDEVLLSWLGGEPLLWAPLREITELYTRTYGLKVSTTTNGTTLGNPSQRAHLCACYEELTISVLGPSDVHDRLRGGGGRFAPLKEAVLCMAREKRAVGRGPKLRANVVLMRSTVATFWSLALELAEWGFEEITFNQLGGRERPSFYEGNCLQANQVARLVAEMPRLRNELAARGVRLCGSAAYLRLLQASASRESVAVTDCQPGQHLLHVSVAGEVSPCSAVSGVCGRNVEELNSTRDVVALPQWFRQRLRDQQPEACRDCRNTNVFGKFSQ